MKTKKDLNELKQLIKQAIKSARENIKDSKYSLEDNELASFICGYISGDVELKK